MIEKDSGITIPLSDAIVLIDELKLYKQDMIFDIDDVNQKAYIRTSIIYKASDNTIIKGLGLIFEMQNIPNRPKAKFAFTYYDVKSKTLNHLYRLDCKPDNQRSHADKKNKMSLYGAHYHHLDDKPSKADISFNSIDDWTDCFNFFCNHVNLSVIGKVEHPFRFELI